MATLVEEVELSKETAEKYLKLYIADISWQPHLKQLWENLKKRYGFDDHILRVRLKEAIACTVMLPTFDKHRITDPPENLLYSILGYHQFNEKDWFALWQKAMKRDDLIEKWRNECVSLGVVHPIEYSPITRQAFNWLYGKANELGLITEENKADFTRRFQNLVMAYGGAVVCNIFMNHEKHVKKVLNWRTGYFFEREIFEVYDIDQVMKIKKQELSKTNQKLVKSIRHD